MGSPTVLSSRDHELRSKFQLPSEYAKTPVLLSIKDKIPYEYTSVFAFKSGHKDEETLSKDLLTWAMNNRIPSALQLDQESFQKVMNAPHHPLVVIAATVPSEEAHTIEIINESSRLWRQQVGSVSQSGDVIFTWMDLDKWASWLKSMYGIKDVSKTTVVITDHQVSEFFFLEIIPNALLICFVRICYTMILNVMGKELVWMPKRSRAPSMIY